jgi:hypothetical protein
MRRKRKIQTDPSDGDEYERKLLRLFGCLAFVVEEVDKLGCSKTAIEARRTGLQLCYEAGSDNNLSIAFSDGVQGHG